MAPTRSDLLEVKKRVTLKVSFALNCQLKTVQTHLSIRTDNATMEYERRVPIDIMSTKDSRSIIRARNAETKKRERLVNFHECQKYSTKKYSAC